MFEDYKRLPLEGGKDFTGQDLRGRDFTDKEVKNCDFTGANLQGAIFRRAYGRFAKFDNADLRGADFQQADFQSASFKGVDARWADMSRGIFAIIDFTEANLQGVDFEYSDLGHSVFQSVDLQRTDLRYADLEYANLKGTVLDPSKTDLPPVTNRALTDAELKWEEDDIVVGFTLMPIIGACACEEVDGKLYFTATLFSHCTITDFHPGIPIESNDEFVDRGFDLEALVKVRCRRSDLLHVGSQMRARRVWVEKSELPQPDETT